MKHIFVKNWWVSYNNDFYRLLQFVQRKSCFNHEQELHVTVHMNITYTKCFSVVRFETRYTCILRNNTDITVHIENILNDFCWGWSSTEYMIIKTRKFCPFWVTTDGETKLICVLQIFALDAHIVMCFRYHFRVKGLLFDLKQRCRKVNPFRLFDLVPLLKN